MSAVEINLVVEINLTKRSYNMKKLVTVVVLITAACAAFAAEGYKVLTKIKIGGTGGWDYVAADPNAHRLYATHGTIVEVVDTESGKVVGQITQLHGVH